MINDMSNGTMPDGDNRPMRLQTHKVSDEREIY